VAEKTVSELQSDRQGSGVVDLREGSWFVLLQECISWARIKKNVFVTILDSQVLRCLQGHIKII
jgi:hypothetical protein